MKRKRRVRRNPLVQDPSVRGTPSLQLEVARLIAEYNGSPEDEPDDVEVYMDFEIRPTWYGRYEISFNSDLGYYSYWSVALDEWATTAGSIVVVSDPRFFYVTNNRTGRFFMAQRTGYTLRVYELRVVEESA